ncbi:MAG: ABC transporter substrate-binding protein [Alphaproteobacteria bacterium]|nr:ABC transporter substrate-binding protein [Alphaproteobacteria bacterium]
MRIFAASSAARHPIGSRLRKAIMSVAFAGLAAACASGGDDGPVVVSTPDRDIYERPTTGRDDAPRQERRSYDADEFIDPIHMRGSEPVRVGLLLPFTASNEAARQTATAMFDAAQLAAFEAGDTRFLLLPKDTKGTASGAAAATRAVLSEGAEIILGPLFGQSVEAAADVASAAGVPIIAFSSDTELSREGVFLLSFPPEVEVARITDYAVRNGLDRFGLIAPGNRYGARVTSSFKNEIALRGGVLVHEEAYEQDVDAMRDPARRLAQYSKDLVPAELRHGFDAEATAAIDDSGYQRGYQAVLVPERGTLLRALAPLFPYYNVNIQKVKLLGVSAWNDPRLTREPALHGAWFAGPDPEIAAGFTERFEAAFGERPPRLASLSYDATLLAARLSQNPNKRRRFSVEAITDPNGYFGADGLFRLRPDGHVERGLAILEIRPGGMQVIDPAPRSFAPGL